MDRRLNFYFYQIVNNRQGALSLPQCLAEIAETPPGAQREIAVTREYVMRLERFDEAHGLILGEMLRKQVVNFPARVPADGLATPLALQGAGLGHNSVFIYKPEEDLLIYERNRNGVSVNRFLQYLRGQVNGIEFSALPVLTVDSLRMLTENQPTKLSLKISEPENLEVFENQALSPLQSIARVKELTGGSYVNIEFGVGRERVDLNKRNIINIVRNMLRNKENDSGGIKSIKANIRDEAGQTTPLDFINAHLKYFEDLDLPDNDPEAVFEEKINAARRALEERYEEFAQQQRL
ncbi:hypothetical protein GR183_09645 [Stappia sp. GBMRC 2046]|uniref:Uncharacterized protein n=1 Tax=Stappia sediminis TaxID=2692190 RepID=A0A7X3LU77_9HYPH|nr:DUF6731 family protein [Stappia sediminis]MXN65171.1 hypothetical protein [Stappia sediminis]